MTTPRRGLFGMLGRNNKSDEFTADDLFADQEAPSDGRDVFDDYARNTDAAQPPSNPQPNQQPPAQEIRTNADKSMAELQGEYNQKRQDFLTINAKLADIQANYTNTDGSQDSAGFAADQSTVRVLQFELPALEREIELRQSSQNQNMDRLDRKVTSFVDNYLTAAASPLARLDEVSKGEIKKAYYDFANQPAIANQLLSQVDSDAQLKQSLTQIISTVYGRWNLTNAPAANGGQRGLGNLPQNPNQVNPQEQAWVDKGYRHRDQYPTDDPNDAAAIIYSHYENAAATKGISLRQHREMLREKGRK